MHTMPHVLKEINLTYVCWKTLPSLWSLVVWEHQCVQATLDSKYALENSKLQEGQDMWEILLQKLRI